jgi:hypothetical protein
MRPKPPIFAFGVHAPLRDDEFVSTEAILFDALRGVRQSQREVIEHWKRLPPNDEAKAILDSFIAYLAECAISGETPVRAGKNPKPIRLPIAELVAWMRQGVTKRMKGAKDLPALFDEIADSLEMKEPTVRNHYYRQHHRAERLSAVTRILGQFHDAKPLPVAERLEQTRSLHKELNAIYADPRKLE